MRGIGEETTQDEGRLFVKFGYHPVKNEQKSIEEGRPIFEDVEMITIMVPGDKDNIVHRPVWDDPHNTNSDTYRFRKQYAAFKSGATQGASGTPLEAWPAVTRAQVEELKAFHCHTVEQLAEMADANASKFMGIQKLRQKARDFLAAAKGAAPLEKMRTELETRDNEIETLKRQLQEQAKDLAELKRARK